MFTKITPEIGKVTKINNNNAHFNADKTYNHVKVMIDNHRYDLLLTDTDIDKAVYRVFKNLDDIETQIPRDREVPSSNMYWMVYSGLVTIALITTIAMKLVGH